MNNTIVTPVIQCSIEVLKKLLANLTGFLESEPAVYQAHKPT